MTHKFRSYLQAGKNPEGALVGHAISHFLQDSEGMFVFPDIESGIIMLADKSQYKNNQPFLPAQQIDSLQSYQTNPNHQTHKFDDFLDLTVFFF